MMPRYKLKQKEGRKSFKEGVEDEKEVEKKRYTTYLPVLYLKLLDEVVENHNLSSRNEAINLLIKEALIKSSSSECKAKLRINITE